MRSSARATPPLSKSLQAELIRRVPVEQGGTVYAAMVETPTAGPSD